MELRKAILGRRSIRFYEDKPLTREIINDLINMGIHAPTASNTQPWAFVIVEDKQFMQQWSEQSKRMLLKEMDAKPHLQKYRGLMNKKNFNIFYDAPCLLLIYGNSEFPSYVLDCSLAAQNIMLTAHDLGLGSCWIGFAMNYGNLPEIKTKLNIPENYSLVAPLVIGYPRRIGKPVPRKEPVIFSWVK